LRNLRKLDCAGKPVSTFPHPALEHIPLKSNRFERNMLKVLSMERFLIDRVIPPGRKTL